MKELFQMMQDPRFHLLYGITQRFSLGPQPQRVRLNREGCRLVEGVTKRAMVYPNMRVVLPSFTSQFSGFKTPVALKANGGDVDAVSGATISSTGAVEAVNRAAKAYAALKTELLGAWGKK